MHISQLGRGSEVDVSVVDDHRARLFGHTVENNAIGVSGIFPHVRHHSLSRQHGRRKPQFDCAEARGVVIGKRLDDGAGGDAQSAQAVENGGGEPVHFGNARVNVQLVVIAAQTVDVSLFETISGIVSVAANSDFKQHKRASFKEVLRMLCSMRAVASIQREMNTDLKRRRHKFLRLVWITVRSGNFLGIRDSGIREVLGT